MHFSYFYDTISGTCGVFMPLSPQTVQQLTGKNGTDSSDKTTAFDLFAFNSRSKFHSNI